MFARISRYKMKPESIADAEEELKELMPTNHGNGWNGGVHECYRR
jgi:hypothetical protein